ncbi:MAG: ABC transporter permease [Nocardioidaceae bacterium]|nr:ABC transporter permease [Nocardioidaceae bacterium]
MTDLSTATAQPIATTTADAGPVLGPRRRRSLGGYLFMPLLLIATLIILYVVVQNRELSSGEQRVLTFDNVMDSLVVHLRVTAISTILVLVIAIPLGVLLTRSFARPITPPAIAVFNIGQAIPSIGLIALFAIAWAIGFWPVVVALVAYTVLPVLRNTMVGLRQVDASVIESARGMGMTKMAVLLRIELPLAVPIIMAGLRTALTINVGTATLGAFVGVDTLGVLIVAGQVQNRQLITVVGGILVAVLALLVDYSASIAEDVLRPRGL